MPSPHERPRYQQVADELRRRIAAGTLPGGAPLPSEQAMITEFGASRGTVRDAIAVLRAEGLVVTQHGRGTYVRATLPVRRLGADRYRGDTAGATGQPSTSFTRDQGIEWADYELDRGFSRVPADPLDAALLGIEVGGMLLRRDFVFRAHGMPQQMSTSSYPLELVDGTPVADPAREPWPGGNLAQLASLGITATEIVEVVRARMPTSDEALTLGIPAGVPVVTITRQTMVGDRAVEVAHIVIPADRVELEYRIPLA